MEYRCVGNSPHECCARSRLVRVQCQNEGLQRIRDVKRVATEHPMTEADVGCCDAGACGVFTSTRDVHIFNWIDDVHATVNDRFFSN